MTQHINSENEKISIEDRKLRGDRVRCLVIWDDSPPNGTGRPAPMLLDSGTIDWLLEQLNNEKTRLSKSE